MCLCSSRAASQRDARVPAGCWYSTVLTVPLGTITVLAAMAEITPVTAPKPGHLAPSFFLSLSLLHPSNTCSPEGLSPCGLRLRWMLLYIYISNNGLIREGFSQGSDQASYQRRSISNHYTHVKLQVEQARTWKHHSLQARNYRAILFFLFFAFLLGIPFCFHALSSDQISSWAGGGMRVGNSQCLPAQPPLLLPGCQARATAHEMCPAVPAVACTLFRCLFKIFFPFF